MTNAVPRVVFVGHSAQPSGAELGLLRLTRAMTRYEPVVVLAEHGPLVDELRSSGVRCEVAELAQTAAGVRHADIKPGRQIVTAARQVYGYGRELGRLLRDLQPDIVDTFTLKAHVYGRLALRSTRVPRVAHVHDRLATQYMRRSGIVLLRPVLGRSDGLVFNSHSTEATVPSLRRGQIRVVVGSAIEPPLQTAAADVGEHPFTFGCVGRLTRWKGQDLALRSFAALCKMYPQRDLRMRFVGGAFFGEDSYVAELRTLAAELGVSERTSWVGHVGDIYAELAHVDTLVHCSTIPEPFGQVIVEGMAYRVPVIAPSEGGPADLVADGVTGLAFTARDARSLTTAMERAVALPAGRRRAMTDAAHSVAERFFADQVARRVEAFYDDVLLSRAGRRRSAPAR